MFKNKLTLFIFLGLILGVLVGWLLPEVGMGMKPLATMFLRMIKMIIAPLVFATLVVGIAGHGSFKNLGSIALKTIIYFEVATTVALFIGLFVANTFQPGMGLDLAPTASNMSEVSKFAAVSAHSNPIESFVHMIPTSVVEAMAKGDILQIVIFATIFSIALAAIKEKGQPIITFLNSLSEVMFKFTEYVMMLAPIGVFAAIAATVGENGIGVLGVYANLIFALYFALFVFLISVPVVACKIFKISFFQLIKALKEPILLAFSTASSEAALPKAMEIVEKFGVPKNIVSFVMPTGYTFNLDGSTLYLSLATLFIVQMSGLNMSIGDQILIMLSLMFASKGIAAVPRVSLVVLTGVLVSFNIPVAGVAILLGIDQVLDMGRTSVNLIGNCVAAVVVSCWDKSFDHDIMRAFIFENQSPGLLVGVKASLLKRMSLNKNPIIDKILEKNSSLKKQVNSMKQEKTPTVEGVKEQEIL